MHQQLQTLSVHVFICWAIFVCILAFVDAAQLFNQYFHTQKDLYCFKKYKASVEAQWILCDFAGTMANNVECMSVISTIVVNVQNLWSKWDGF